MKLRIFPWHSLKTRVTLFTLTLFLISIWSLALYSRYKLHHNMEQASGEQQFSTVSIIAADVNDQLTHRLETLELIAARITPAIIDNAASTQAFLDSHVSFKTLFNRGGIVARPDGIVIAEVPTSIGRVGVDYSDREWMIEALKGKTIIGKPVIGKKLRLPAFMMATPVKDSKGKVIGALCGTTDLNQPNFLSQIMDNRYGKTGGYLLVSPKIRTIVYATDKKRIMEVLPTPGIDTLIDRYINGYEGSGVTVNPLGVEVLASSRGIPVSGWYVTALMPTEEAFAPIHSLQKQMLLATIFLTLLAGGLTWWMLKRQLAPVFTTIKIMATLSDTDQSHKPLPITRRDEIGELIGGFNHLLETLGKQDEALRISEQTARNLAKKSELIAEIGRIISSTLTIGEVYERFCDKVEELIPFDRIAVNIINLEDYTRVEMYAKGKGSFGSGIGQVHSLTGTSIEQTLRTKASLLINSKSIEDMRRKFPGISALNFEVLSMMTIPLILKDEVFGALSIHSTAVDAYSDGDLHLAERVGSQIAGAIANAQLYQGRQQAEEALRSAAQEWSNSFDAMSDGVSIHDEDYTILRANRSLCKLLGKRQEEIIGKKCFGIFHGTDNPISFCPIELTRQTGRDEHTEFFEPVLNKWLFVSTSPVFDDAGRLMRIVHVVSDITNRKQVEEEKRMMVERLQRSEKMESLGQLAGGVAHDLNNVLGVLTGYSEILVEQLPEDNPLKRYAANILKSSEKGATIVQDLLTLARRGVVVDTVVDLNSVISDYLTTPVYDKLKTHHPQVTIKTDLEQGLLNIKGSPVHLEKTVMNLVSNAAEAIHGSGEVHIRTENRYLDHTLSGYDQVEIGDYAVLTVSDTGGGIAAADIVKIFEPFYTKKSMGRSGTGLGLAIVWGTVKDHNGYIDVQSNVGQGTTFTLYFPATREEMADTVQKIPPEQYQGKGESVLVVDDVQEQRQVATTILTQLGYRVNAVSSGKDALVYLRSNKVDIMVLDMIMDPGIDGLDTYKLVLDIHPHQKAIIVSGFSETDRVRDALKLGAGAYVKKPYLKEKIGVAIRDELARK